MPVKIYEDVILPDGRQMNVSGLGELLFMGSWGHMFWLRTPRISLRVQSGVVGTIDTYESMNEIQSNHVGSVVAPAGYTVDIRENDNSAMTIFLATWRHWELTAAIAGTNVPVDIALDLLSHFDFVDTPNGLAVHPVPGLDSSVEVVVSANSIDKLCGITVRPTDGSTDNLPHGTGKQVLGGEVWSRINRGDGDASNGELILSNATSITQINHHSKNAKTAAALAQRLVVSIGE